MNDSATSRRWFADPTTLVAGALALGGLFLANVNAWFLLLSAAGVLGPGILREVGWLSDRDEFQRLVNYRAGYHAYLVSAGVAFLLVAFFRSDERVVKAPQELATLFLALLWFTWLLSSLITYWGARKAAFRILIGFGSGWLAFTILSNTGNEWTGWAALLIQPLLAVPFFVLAWLSKRRPRIAGIFLLATALFLAQFLGFFRLENLTRITSAITLILFIGPLAASGLALLCTKGPSDFEHSGGQDVKNLDR